MQAYHNDPKVKQKYVSRMQAHINADELVRGEGFVDGHGCAVGCILNKYDHSAFPEELGVPEWIARLIDDIHEHTSDEVWPTFALDFLQAIPEGKDLEPIKYHLSIFIQEGNLVRVESLPIANDLKTQISSAINQVVTLHKVSLSAGFVDESAAESAARSAAWSAAWSAARSAARTAAWSAAWSAAESAAESAARAVARSAARSAAESAAWSAFYDEIAKKLLELLRD